ncbi:Hsp20/alpha crystallin family protein [soil metagenome]
MLLQRTTDNDTFGSLSEMHRLQQQLNRLLSVGSVSNTAHEFPAINVWTSEEGVMVRTEIPGIDPEAVEISLVNDTITIKGERSADCQSDDERCHRQERGFGQFARSIKLPFAVEADAVKAEFTNGVLQVELPRAAAEKPRKINVSCQ